ncbi:hypothetical protein C2S52_006407 [Perilla frutescens var. hirtella]|nr:hypothetical protein C2S52_006407 [Perilla frutescens var. hirtella]
MEGRLVTNFAQHQTTKAVWDSLANTYGSGVDPFQIYDLETKANKVNQGKLSLEDYWNKLQVIYLSIDRREPNPLDCCEKRIKKYWKLIANRRLYQFLSKLDTKYDGIQRDILKETLIPSTESAFSKKHTKDTCFQLVGYPKWWEDNHKVPQMKGKSAIRVDGQEVAGAAIAVSSLKCLSNCRNLEEEEDRKCVFLGYPEGVKCYRLWVRDEPGFKIVISRDVIFHESEFLYLSSTSNMNNPLLTSESDDVLFEVESQSVVTQHLPLPDVLNEYVDTEHQNAHQDEHMHNETEYKSTSESDEHANEIENVNLRNYQLTRDRGKETL